MIRKIIVPTGALIVIAAGISAWGANTNTTITVNSLDDPGSPGVCALRDAITVANNGGRMNGCSAESGGPYQIGFQSGLSGSIKLTSPLTVTGNMTITGPSGTPGITIDGGDRWVLISSTTGGTLDLENLTLANGFSGLPGAGIENVVSTLTVTNCTLSSNNLVQGAGAAIYNLDGTVTVTNSTFSGNNAGDGSGGGIYNFGTLTVTNSTFSGNLAGDGAAITNLGALTVTNSTFSGNIAGDGIIDSASSSAITVTNSTFFDNTSSVSGSGVVYNIVGTVNLHGTIFARSSGANCAGITDAGYNLSDDDSCGFSGTSQNNLDALLDANGLADNGGPTETIALQSGSPALNAIPPADCTYPAGTLNPCSTSSSNQLTCDQRGSQRPAPGQANCDIGAYEGVLGSGPIATLSATSLSFAPQPVGSISPHQSVTLTNTGGGTLKGGIVISGDFGKQTLCSHTLGAGQSCSINVAFKPTAPGALSGALTVTTNAPGQPQTVALSGTGATR